ncbi:hypothetical protein EI555_018574, partial [Monodon monoceros]
SLLLTERMKLSPDSSTLTINPVRREDAGDYQCEVSNLGSSSRSDPLRLGVKYDSTQGGSSGLSGGAIAGIVIGVLAGVALIAPLVYFLASDQRDLTEHKSSDHNQSQGYSDNSPNKAIDEGAYSALNFNAQESKKPTSASYPQQLQKWFIEKLKKKKKKVVFPALLTYSKFLIPIARRFFH